MKTTVEIATPLLDEAKQFAADQGITLRELIEQGLRRELDDRRARVKKPFVLPDCSNHEMRLVPGAPIDDWERLRDICYGIDLLEEKARSK